MLRYARDGGPVPAIVEMGQLIERFGVAAVLGRTTLAAGEMKALVTAESIMKAWQSRASAKDAVLWEVDEPGYAQILEAAEMIEGQTSPPNPSPMRRGEKDKMYANT